MRSNSSEKGKVLSWNYEKKYNKIFDERNSKKFLKDTKKNGYEKMVYKYLPDAAKMIPKCSTQLKAVKEHFSESSEEPFIVDTKAFKEPLVISRRIFNLNNVQYDKNDCTKVVDAGGVKQFQKGYLLNSRDKAVFKKALTDWIDFCKDFLSKYESTQDFDLGTLKKSEEYDSLYEFYNDISKISYRIYFQNISEAYIKEKNQNGELYLFQIKNKDWNDGATGRKNLHTLYFERLFSNENIERNFPFKLNGEAEIFYRPRTEELEKEKIVTQKNRVTLNKGSKAFHKNRYTEDKVFFHLPITLNRTKSEPYFFNSIINEYLANTLDVNIIGIDRGENHLAYYSVVNQKGEILKDKKGNFAIGSLNFVGQDKSGSPIDYHLKLEDKAKSREQARKNWQEIEGIKDLKKGYISQFVRKISDLAIEYNAIIVLEDLNMRFKQIRSGMEKSVYQQLEKALIEKLNFLVNKEEADPDQAGHLLRAYQLTAPFETFKNMGKQTGIIFYTQANYTSKTCPKCGFRPNIRFKCDTKQKARDLVNKLDKFVYDRKDDRFIIEYSLSKMWGEKSNDRKKRANVLYKEKNRKDVFVISTDTIRYRWRNKRVEKKSLKAGEEIYSSTERGTVLKYDINECIKRLFRENNVQLSDENFKNIINQTNFPKEFYKQLFYYFSLAVNTRDSVSGSDIDRIHCPMCGFNSENGFQGCEFNGDANGAYNIARKGSLILEKIKQYKANNDSMDKMGWADIFIGIEEWDKSTQN